MANSSPPPRARTELSSDPRARLIQSPIAFRDWSPLLRKPQSGERRPGSVVRCVLQHPQHGPGSMDDAQVVAHDDDHAGGMRQQGPETILTAAQRLGAGPGPEGGAETAPDPGLRRA